MPAATAARGDDSCIMVRVHGEGESRMSGYGFTGGLEVTVGNVLSRAHCVVCASSVRFGAFICTIVVLRDCARFVERPLINTHTMAGFDRDSVGEFWSLFKVFLILSRGC